MKKKQKQQQSEGRQPLLDGLEMEGGRELVYRHQLQLQQASGILSSAPPPAAPLAAVLIARFDNSTGASPPQDPYNLLAQALQ